MISVELIGIQVDPLSGAAAVVLREHDAPNRLLPIIVGTSDAGSIAIAASGQRLPRPMAHDLMAALVEGLDGHLDAVEVTELHDGAFLAELTVSGPGGQRRIDTRPSDAIALAVRLQAPLFVSEHVLDEAGALPIDEPEVDQVALEASIEAEVDQFRAFLDELDPDDFVETTATELTAGQADDPADDPVAAQPEEATSETAVVDDPQDASPDESRNAAPDGFRDAASDGLQDGSQDAAPNDSQRESPDASDSPTDPPAG